MFLLQNRLTVLLLLECITESDDLVPCVIESNLRLFQLVLTDQELLVEAFDPLFKITIVRKEDLSQGFFQEWQIFLRDPLLVKSH